MSFGFHLTAAVLSVCGLALAEWLRSRGHRLVGLATVCGVMTGMVGLALAEAANAAAWPQTGLVLWFVGGCLLSSPPVTMARRWLFRKCRRNSPVAARTEPDAT
ncbi:MAG: hypothetical protein LBG60_01580 [Bifidobacteriaceae bacterium]|nr:hypothetical protein [Bifidobacteriaceae bacterium]